VLLEKIIILLQILRTIFNVIFKAFVTQETIIEAPVLLQPRHDNKNSTMMKTKKEGDLRETSPNLLVNAAFKDPS
jgi:hypothetical protein